MCIRDSYAGTLAAGTGLTHHIEGKAYLLVSEGDITVDGHPAKRGDGLAISDQSQITLAASADSEILVIEVPGLVEAR